MMAEQHAIILVQRFVGKKNNAADASVLTEIPQTGTMSILQADHEMELSEKCTANR